MKKFKTIIAAASAVLTLSALCIGASANTLASSYALFEWDGNGAKITNKTNDNRLMTAMCKVYEDNTGFFVTSINAANIGTYGTYAYAQNESYPMSNYNMICSGKLYKSNVEYSGTASVFEDKVYD